MFDLALAASDIAWLLCVLLAAGAVAGLLAGLFGIGGGTVLVPALYEAYTIAGVSNDVVMQMTLGTSFAVILPTAIRSYRAHSSKGAVDGGLLRALAPYAIVGVVMGGLLVSVVSGQVLQWIWIVCSLVIAVRMLIGSEKWRIADEVPDNWLMRLVVTIVGIVSTLISVGGGIFLVAIFRACGWSMIRSVATSSGFGPVIALPGILAYIWAGFGVEQLPPLSVGFVSLLSVAIVAPISMLTAPIGVRWAHNVSQRTLEVAFALYLMAAAGRFVVTALR
jgi:uncharacterized membrane protein YfcA